jgi:hypothetical protein
VVIVEFIKVVQRWEKGRVSLEVRYEDRCTYGREAASSGISGCDYSAGL